MIVGGAGIFGLVKAAEGGINLQRAAYVYAGLAIVATVAAYFFMDNLTRPRTPSPREQLQVVKNRQTWVMSFLYIGTFGSFIGYSAAMPLLIKLNFWVPDPAPLGTGIFFAYYAFLGAGIGSLTRPFGGWLADKYGGAQGHPGRVRRDDRVHPRGAVDADPAHPEPDRRRRDRHATTSPGSRGSSASSCASSPRPASATARRTR